MIAKLQQTIVLLILASLACWGFFVLPTVLHILYGLLTLVTVYSAFLAIEFIVIHVLNRHEKIPRASLQALLCAWWRETTTAPKVFLWRQPFCTFAEADHLIPTHERGVVFIHGFLCNRAFWTPWMTQLRLQNRAFAAVSLEPIFDSIDNYSAIIEAAIVSVTQATGQAPVLICHSMGGLAARAWLRFNAANVSRVHHIITIGTPHFGTKLSQAQPVAKNMQQMQWFSAWTQQLAQDESAALYYKFTCWYSHCDNIVVPVSTAMLPSADNRLVTGQGHVSMAFQAQLMQASLAKL
jgi:pimeloyl-ACP methyl ester carboxylesterase